MTDAEIITAVYGQLSRPRCTLKRLARAMNAPIETARTWFYRGTPSSRRREIALVLAEQIEREMEDLALVRAQIDRILEVGNDAVDCRQDNKSKSATTSPEGEEIRRPFRASLQDGRSAEPTNNIWTIS